jgi:uncharacterized protein YcbK (DUF882 family)
VKSKYFKDKEFACKCGCGGNIKPELLKKLHTARGKAQVPFHINSGYRCESYNLSLPKHSKTSSHLKGLAVDISAKDGATREKILSALFGVGFKRVGIDKEFIHVDIDKDKTNSCWVY